MNMIKRSNDKSFRDWIYLVLLGSIGFSMLGIHLIMNVLHFPIFFIEWLYIPIIYVNRRKAARKLSRINVYHLGLLILMFMSSVYGIVDSGSASFLAEYRSIIYLLALYRFEKDKGFQHHYIDFLYICLFATISELLYVAVFATRTIVSSTNCLAASIAILGFFISERYKTGLFAFIISMLTGILSGYRIGIVLSALSLLLACCYNIFHSNENEAFIKKIRKLTYVVFVFSVMFYFIGNYESIVMVLASRLNMDQFAIFRVTTRMRSILTMDFSQSQDTERLRIWTIPFTDFFASILPRGFIRTPGLYIDVPLLILYDVFGSLVSWLIIVYIVFKGFQAVRKLKRYGNILSVDQRRCAQISIYIMPVLTMLLLLNGTFIKNLYQAIQTGIMLGLLVHTANYTKKSGIT